MAHARIGAWLGGWVLATAAAAPLAQEYPVKTVRFVVGFAPGGGTDIMARLAAQHMGDHLKQPLVVDNRAGGDGIIAIRMVKASRADGYTLLAATGTAAQQMALRRDPGYDLVKDFMGVA